MNKKLFAYHVLTALFLMVSQGAWALVNNDRFTVDHIIYRIINATNYYVAACGTDGTVSDVTIPATVVEPQENKTYTVTEIGAVINQTSWKGVTNATIPEGVTSLQSGAFRDASITTLELPASLTTISEIPNALEDARSMTTITVASAIPPSRLLTVCSTTMMARHSSIIPPPRLTRASLSPMPSPPSMRQLSIGTTI